MHDEPEFKQHADEALAALYRALSSASDDYEFKVDLVNGAITVEFSRRRAKFVISPQHAARQVSVSARGRSYKLDWDVVQNTFVLGSTGQTLKQLLEETISAQLGEEVTL